MSDYQACILNHDAYAFYFECIKYIQPESILDIGPFLKRIGALSRRTLNYTIPEEVVMDAVDCMADIPIPVYETIYRSILPFDGFLAEKNCPRGRYDLINLIRVAPLCTREQLADLCRWLQKHCRYVIFEENESLFSLFDHHRNAKLITLNQSVFCIVEF